MLQHVLPAVGLFAATDVDDLLLLALWFSRARQSGGARRVVAGQYLGFVAITAVCVLAALGLRLLPDGVAPWLGLVPVALGVRAGIALWRGDEDDDEADAVQRSRISVLAVAGVTVANGGDNLGVYVPVLTAVGPSAMAVYVAVFLVMVAVWCALGHVLANHRALAGPLDRWGEVLLPWVLVAVGVSVLLTAR